MMKNFKKLKLKEKVCKNNVRYKERDVSGMKVKKISVVKNKRKYRMLWKILLKVCVNLKKNLRIRWIIYLRLKRRGMMIMRDRLIKNCLSKDIRIMRNIIIVKEEVENILMIKLKMKK
jgi:hypothetical protein